MTSDLMKRLAYGILTGFVLGWLLGAAVANAAPQGVPPAPLNGRFMVGMQDTEAPAVWMPANVPLYHARYRYLVKGWEDNWAPGTAKDGRFAKRYLDGTPAGVMPVFTFYQLLGESGSESNEYATLRNVTAMRSYFTAFRTLMQVAKASGRPVLVHLEPDAYAYIQIGSGGNTASPAAVASTGLAELAGLPNTVAGWGQAFGRLRQAVGANNVLLAPHYSTWSTGTDLMRGSGLSADINTHVARSAAFLNALGAYDMIAAEWLDRDAAYRNIWWTEANFDRDLAILSRLNALTSKRVFLWQVPWGGALQRNVYENGTVGSGWKSIHVDYIFGALGADHRAKMVDAGLVGVLFGAGATGQSTHKTSLETSQQLWSTGTITNFLKPSSSPPVCAPVCTVECTPGGTLPGGMPLP